MRINNHRILFNDYLIIWFSENHVCSLIVTFLISQADLLENQQKDRRSARQAVNNERLLCVQDELLTEHKHRYRHRSNIRAACRLD